MKKKRLEKYFRDPIHRFVKVPADELKIVDHPRFQRLRDISQLSFSYLVYPSTTHKRFEHSLGVMKLADDIFDIRFNRERLPPKIREKFKQQIKEKDYWRKVLKIAALCHDIGHLPFSHTLEGLLKEETSSAALPEGKNHEDLSAQIIVKELGQRIREIKVGNKPIDPHDVAFVATGKSMADPSAKPAINDEKQIVLKEWKEFLKEIITGDLFGADRMDYMVRDAYHAGVPYGVVDIYQILRAIVPYCKPGMSFAVSNMIDSIKKKGDLAMIASFLMCRQLMYSQVYQHPVSEVYDLHLAEFVRELKKEKKISSIEDLVNHGDAYILNMLQQANLDSDCPYHEHSKKILNRKHYRLVKELDVKGVDKLRSDFMVHCLKARDLEKFFSEERSENIDGIIKWINKKYYKKAKIVMTKHKLPKLKEKRNELPGKYIPYDELSGYKKIIVDLDSENFGYCYIFAPSDKTKEVKRHLNKIKK